MSFLTCTNCHHIKCVCPDESRNNMSDATRFKHGEEGTHSACLEMVDKFGSAVGCCACNNHKCQPLPVTKKADEQLKQTISDIIYNFGYGEVGTFVNIKSVKAHTESIYEVLQEERNQLLNAMEEIIGEDQIDTFDPQSEDIQAMSYEEACDIETRNELRAEQRSALERLRGRR